MKIFAHRGASKFAPENTMAAFELANKQGAHGVELANKQGAHGVELDVQRTADGFVVVAHDFVLDRVSNGAGEVSAKTLEELKALDFGGKFDPKFAGEKIPTLDEVLGFIAATDMMLNIEIKSRPVKYDRELVRLVGEKINASGLRDRIVVSSFDHQTLVDVHENCPEVDTGILYFGNFVNIWDYCAAIGAKYVHAPYASLTEACVKGCHDRGLLVNACTVDGTDEIQRMAAIGSDRIITNVPDVALTL